MSRIDIGVEERDGDRLDHVLLNTRAQPLNLFDVKRDQNRALRIDAFLHLVPQIARNERRVTPIIKVEWQRTRRAPDLEHVAESLGGDERRASALALEQHIDDLRGAVLQRMDRARIDIDLRQAFENALDKVPIIRQRLAE